jgi:tRNA A37 threonylcarbamoyladenosine modification protein TsaB
MVNLSLYFSLASPFIFLALYQDEKCLISIQKENARLHSENFLWHLRQILNQHQHSLAEIKEIYFTSPPSGQTGLRVSLTFLTTLQVLNPKIKIYHLNTLLLQAGKNKCISLLTIDSRESKYHAAIYEEKKCLLETQIISQEDLKNLTEKFPDFPLLKDYQGVNFLINFQELKSEFILLDKVEKIDY